MAGLPNEIIENISMYLNDREKQVLALVCRRFNQVVKNQRRWISHTEKDDILSVPPSVRSISIAGEGVIDVNHLRNIDTIAVRGTPKYLFLPPSIREMISTVHVYRATGRGIPRFCALGEEYVDFDVGTMERLDVSRIPVSLSFSPTSNVDELVIGRNTTIHGVPARVGKFYSTGGVVNRRMIGAYVENAYVENAVIVFAGSSTRILAVENGHIICSRSFPRLVILGKGATLQDRRLCKNVIQVENALAEFHAQFNRFVNTVA